MNKVYVIIAVIVSVIIIATLVFISTKPKDLEKLSPTATTIQTRTIRGIGFKDGAWSKYSLSGFGIEFEGEGKRNIRGLGTIKSLSFDYRGKKFIGIEGDIQPDITKNERYGFLSLFDIESGQQAYGLLRLRDRVLCLSALEGVKTGGIYQEFGKENVEESFSLEDVGNFIGEDEYTLPSGKKVKVLKFKKNINVSEKGVRFYSQELWISGEVPMYYVYFAEKYIENGTEKIGPELKLIDFGLSGAISSFTSNDIAICESEAEEQPLPIPQQGNKLYCNNDDDCVCGIDRETKECAYGNRRYIDASVKCQDFCEGITGSIRIKCINNLCMPAFLE